MPTTNLEPAKPNQTPTRRAVEPPDAPSKAQDLDQAHGHTSVELGTRNATIVTLRHVAQALRVSFQEIFAEGPRRTSKIEGKLTTCRMGVNLNKREAPI